jgi:hypothetical protein
MAQGQSRSRALVPGAERALDQFKYEVARNIGVNPPQSGYWGDLSSRDCGAVGGNMVRAMIQLAEQRLSGTAGGTTMGAGTIGAGAGTMAGGTAGTTTTRTTR